MYHVPDVKPHTCYYCSKHLMEQNDTGDLEVRYSFDFAYSAAQQGCLFFRWCFAEEWNSVASKGDLRQSMINQERKKNNPEYIQIRIDNDTQDRSEIFKDGELWKETLCYTYHGQYNDQSLNVAKKRKDDAAARIIKNRPMNYTPGSGKSHELAKQWISSCGGGHRTSLIQQCPLPSRIIDVGDQNRLGPRLCLTNGFDIIEPYLCLSYCWGGEQIVKLSNANLNTWSSDQGILFTALPRTFQDAIVLTRELGFRYLWIDALCILQDNFWDKEREIARMSTYFQGAAFTILASRATKCTDGFLQPRAFGADSEHEFLFRVKIKSPENERTSTDFKIGHIGISMRFAAGFVENQFMEPVQSRGWILQEQLISPRVLEYGTHYTYWKCSAHISCGDKQDGGGDSLSQPWTPPLLTDTTCISTMASFLYPTLSNAEAAWLHIVEDFASRSTTRPEDRVFAIAGIAERYSQYIPCRYLAGIWESSVPYALLWRIGMRSDRRPRSSDFPAPTWSWMSVHGGLTYRNVVEGQLQPVIELKAAKMNPKLGSAKYGGTQNSQITIIGRPIQALLTNGASAIALYDAKDLRKQSEGRVITKRFWLDTSEVGRAAHENIEVWILPVLKNQAKDKDFQFNGLILSPLGPFHQYHREGYFECWLKEISVDVELLYNSPSRAITIY